MSVPHLSLPMNTVQLFAQHIRQQLLVHRNQYEREAIVPPLFVAVQGPQGSGKTTVCESVRQLLLTPPANLNVAVMSIDDLYHTHDHLVRIAQANGDCVLLSGRGHPGTHDVQLGQEILRSLQTINHTGSQVKLPVFDKSLFDGQGDRSSEERLVTRPLDVFILEGWCIGFKSISEQQVDMMWLSAPEQSILRRHAVGHLELINSNLREYEDKWYGAFHFILQLETDDLSVVYRWRLQQEHSLKSIRGGRGMTDQQVKKYMPGYLLFGHTIVNNSHWRGRSCSILLDHHRDPQRVVFW